MNESEWFYERDSRTRLYPGARLIDPGRSIHINAMDHSIATYSGQVTLITLCNLLGRMARKVSISMPSVAIVPPLPWSEAPLDDHLIRLLNEACPFGTFEIRPARTDDTVITLGPSGDGPLVHGSGWSSFFGPSKSPLANHPESSNPFGPAFAAILAVAALYHSDFAPSKQPISFDTLTWKAGESDRFDFPADADLGNIWSIGVGSVGSATLYFLTLASRRLVPSLFDMDQVKIHNLDRSPIFADRHTGSDKVDVVAEYLRSVGCGRVFSIPHALDEAHEFQSRPPGVPDQFLSAANENNVRPIIEEFYPPLQIYGTTGRSWQASLLRHIPLDDPCSCCAFPSRDHAPTTCATAQIPSPDSDKKTDAAVPFLSFAAGLMAAAEVFKLHMEGYPFTTNRIGYYTKTSRIAHAPLFPVDGCICQARKPVVHKKVLADTAYSKYSGF